MAIVFRQDHFALFGLPRRFALDAAALDAAYRAIQARVHPDRFAGSTDAERRASMQWTTRVNEAYRTLRSPLSRARYLLELAGVDAGIETNTAMPADFLVAQMEWREAVEEAASDPRELDAVRRRLKLALAEEYARIEHELDSSQLNEAAATLRKLMFFEKVREEIDEALERLEA